MLIVVVGVGLGSCGAAGAGAIDTGVLIVVTTVSAALPSFVAAVVLHSCSRSTCGWFPALGDGHGLLDQLQHLTLPAIALARRRWPWSRA